MELFAVRQYILYSLISYVIFVEVTRADHVQAIVMASSFREKIPVLFHNLIYDSLLINGYFHCVLWNCRSLGSILILFWEKNH